jgi:hypothetical protein
MIISASRRTDIPAFYARWFINRVRAGFCISPNPFNPQQAAPISLAVEDVQVIVFWTRNPRPLFPYLDELDRAGYRYYFQYTLMDNPRPVDPYCPRLPAALDTFRRLADRVGAQRVIWRYDPILFSEQTTPDFHRRAYRQIAEALRGYSQRSVISLADAYAKTRKRLAALAAQGFQVQPATRQMEDGSLALAAGAGEMLADLAAISRQNGMQMVSCAEELDLQAHGILPGKCVDDQWIQHVFGLEVTHSKDANQRKACGCVTSKDIGMYDSCLFGCAYCYATSDFVRARENYRRHDPHAPQLVPGGKIRQISDASSAGV